MLATMNLTNATAAFTTSSLTAGSHKITARYLGDGNLNPDDSQALTQNVNKANTNTTIASSFNPSAGGQSVTSLHP